MLDNIIKFSLKNRGFVLIASLVLLVLGTYEASKLPVDVFPDLNRPTVTVMTESHGLAPEEVETLVTFPLEVALNGMPGLKRMRSSSGVGLSIIWLEFDWGTDIYLNRQLVAEKLSLTSEQLPEEVVPMMAPISSIMGEIQLIGLSAKDENVTGMDLRALADWTIRPRLLSISGIAQVVNIGGGVKEFKILLDSEKLRSKNLSLEDIQQSLSHISENTTGGFVNLDNKEFLIRNLGRVESIEDIKNSVVGTFLGSAVTVADIAEVSVGPQTMRGDASVDGKPGVIMAIKKQPGTSTLELTENISLALESLKKELPSSVELNGDLFKQSVFIYHAVDNVKEALRDGAILVTLILFLFLFNFRTTFITLTAIPLSFALTAIVFKFFGMEINTMTLGGLAISVGLLVDDAIVDVENVFRRLRENSKLQKPRSSLVVTYEASKEIRSSIIFATTIVVLVFMPLFFMSGLEGQFFAPLGISFVVSLVASLVVSLTLTPVLCSYLLPKMKGLSHDDNAFVKGLKKGDEKIVRKVIDKPFLVIIPTVLLLLGSLALLPQMANEFLPKFNEGTAVLSIIQPPGISLEESDRLGREAEKVLLQIPEVKHVSRRTGRAELDEHAEGVNNSEVDVDFHLEGRSKEDILNDIRDKLSEILPEAGINIGQPISHRLDHMMSGVNAEIALKVFGKDLEEIKRIAYEVYTTIEEVDGLVDLQIERQVDIPQIKTYFFREDAKKYNVNVGQLAEQLEMALQGDAVAQVVEGQKVTNVFARLGDESRSSVESIQNITVNVLPSGERVPLKAVADVYESTGPNMINRENMQRRIVIQANVSGRGLSEVIEDVKKKIEEKVDFPEGYYITYGGQFESQQRAAQIMIVLGLASMLAIYLLLYSSFKSWFITAQIMLSIPLAVIGAIVAVYLTGKIISIATIVAFVALCGIASRNGILMIAHYLHLMVHEGESFSKEMVVRGTLERLVPVLMTAISAILGLFPLLLSAGAPGKEILYPVAVVIVGGLLSSTVLDMWITPAVFYRFGRKSAEQYVENFNNKKEEL